MIGVDPLPTSVAPLGNRSASGEFIQRAPYNPGAGGSSDGAIYALASETVTWAVAYSTLNGAWTAGHTESLGTKGTCFHSITTTNGVVRGATTNSSENPADLAYFSQGA